MFHDYTLTKLAEAHVRELLAEKRAYALTKRRRPQVGQFSRASSVQASASPIRSPDAAGVCR